MEETRKQAQETWVTLRQAARMLNCSIKTIRRRVESGKLRSMVEYQGSRAIRLVARDDVLRDAPPLEALLPPGSLPENLSALREDLPGRFELVLRHSLSEFKREAGRAGQRTRLYLLGAAGATLILLVFFFSLALEKHSLLLRRESASARVETASALKVAREVSRQEIRRARQNAQVARVLGEASLQELESSRTEVETLRSEVAALQEDLGRLLALVQGLKKEQGEGIEHLERILAAGEGETDGEESQEMEETPEEEPETAPY